MIKVNDISAMGFPKEAVTRILLSFNGDVERTIAALLSESQSQSQSQSQSSSTSTSSSSAAAGTGTGSSSSHSTGQTSTSSATDAGKKKGGFSNFFGFGSKKNE
jgi:hypothetical protein